MGLDQRKRFEIGPVNEKVGLPFGRPTFLL